MRVFSLSIVVVLAAGCTATLWSPHEAEDCESPRRVHHSAVEPDDFVERPVIMTLRTRDHDVVVHGGHGALRFTVAMADGSVVGRLLDASDFEARFPELHEHFESAFADEGLGSTWAGL
jgi:hypothetical protein